MLTTIRKRFLIGCLTAGLLTFSGCSRAAMGSDSLLRPPRATGDKAAIQDIIRDEAGGSYSLKYPQKGENRSAIIMRNENTDNEYAIALYATEDDTKLNVSIITYQPDKKVWQCLGTYANTGSGVDRVLFCDINGDKREEVIIGWTAYNSTQKSLTAYSFKSDEVYEMGITETYDELVVADITNDQCDDLVLLQLSTQETASTATLLQYSEQDKRPVGTCSLELESDVIAFSNIMVGDVAIRPEVKPSTSTSTGNDTASRQAEEADDRSIKLEASALQNTGASSAAETSVREDPPVSASTDTESEPSSDRADPKDRTSSEAGTGTEESTPDAPAGTKDRVPSAPVESEDDTSSEPSDGNSSEVPRIEDKGSPPIQVSVNAVKRGILVDGKRSDGTFCTQIICYDIDEEELIDPISQYAVRSPSGQYINPTGRSEAIFCRDINGDGVLEVPVVSQMNASVDESGAAVCNQIAWSNYDMVGQKLTPVLYTVMNAKDGYYVCLPDRWNGNVTARSDAETRQLSFYLWNTTTSSLGDKLLTVYRFTEQQWAEEPQQEYLLPDVHIENSKAVVAVKIFKTNADDSLNLSADEVQQGLLFAL